MSTPLSLSELDLPRRNGELVFDAPWQSTVFGLAAAVIDNAFGGDREPFRQQLIKAIAADLWRDGQHGVSVHVDLWDSYLEPA